MTGLAIALAVLAAVGAVGLRRLRRLRRMRSARRRPGSSAERAIPIRSFAEMDRHLPPRCARCGGTLDPSGEGTRESGARRLRVARLVCRECERAEEVFFDTTDVVH